MDTSDSCLPLSEIRIHDTFDRLFPKRTHVLEALKRHMQENGFDSAFPLILAYGPWIDHDVLLDGHCRRQVCQELGIERVPIVRRSFETESAALEYMIHVQKDRRNLSDAEILNCVATLDQTKTAGRPKKLASCEANSDAGKSANRTASILGISRSKVEKVRTILKHADDDVKQSIQSGKSINQAYKEIQVQRKEKEDRTASVVQALPPVSENEASRGAASQADDALDPLAKEDYYDNETDTAAHESLNEEVGMPPESSHDGRCWLLQVINGFDPACIDYVIVGQGMPPDKVLKNQQVFMAPHVAVGQGDDIKTEEDAATEESPPIAPPTWRGVANLTNHDAEGWYELEKQWAKYVPGFVPEPPEELAVETAMEETASQGTSVEGDEPTPSLEPETKHVDPALETIAFSLERGHGEGTRLERWAKRAGIIVYLLSDGTRKIDRKKLIGLVQSVDELNHILKGPVRSEYAWFPQAFHRICQENGYDIPLPDSTDGFEVNLLLDHLCTKGVYQGGSHYPQNQDSITAKLEFLAERWTDVCADVRNYGFVQGLPESPLFDWLVVHGENVFNCVHHKMQAIDNFQFDEVFRDAGMALN